MREIQEWHLATGKMDPGGVPYTVGWARYKDCLAALEAQAEEHDKNLVSHTARIDGSWRQRLKEEREHHESELAALRRELGSKAEVLITAQHPRLIGEPLRIHHAFYPSVERLCGIANDCGVKLHVTHSVRRLDQVLQDTVVAEALRSNHHAGSAVDINVVCDGEWFNSTKMRKAYVFDLPKSHGVYRFIRDVLNDDTLRWGGIFATPDPVHVDDNLVGRDPEEWARRVKEIRDAE